MPCFGREPAVTFGSWKHSPLTVWRAEGIVLPPLPGSHHSLPNPKSLPHAGTETPPSRFTTEPSHTTAAVNVLSPAPAIASNHATDASSPTLANGASPTAKEKRTRRWASLPTEELDRMIIAALQQKGACSLKELTLGTGYTSTSRLLQRAYTLEKQGMLEVVKEGRGYLIDIANRQLQ